MLVKQLLTGGGDYGTSLRQRRWAALALLAVTVLYAASFYLSNLWLSKKL